MAGVITFIEVDDSNAYELRSNLYNIWPVAGGIIGDERPITAITDIDDGRMVAGTYTVTFLTASPGVSGVVSVSTIDANNPWKTNAKSVFLDDDPGTPGIGTLHNDVVGGVGIYFSNSVNAIPGWSAKIVVGGYVSSSSVVTPVTEFGNLRAGATSTYKRIGAKNTGDTECTSCAVGIYPAAYFKNTTNTPLYKIRVIGKSALAGKYVISVTNFAGGTADVSVTQYSYSYESNTWDLLIGATARGTFACDSDTMYENIIYDVGVVLSDTITGNSEAAVYIDSISGAQVAPDVSGDAGTWVNTSNVVLTGPGGVSGAMQVGDVAYFWLRVVSGNTDLPGNLRRFLLRPSGLSSGALIE